jgi:chromosome segregation ATPase
MTRTQTVLVAAAAISLAVAAGTGVYETHRLSCMQKEILALQQKQAPLAKRLEQLRQERDEAARQLAALQQEDKVLRAGNATPADAPTNPPPSVSARASAP